MNRNKEISRKKSEVKETYAELANDFKKTKSTKTYTKLYHKMFPNLRNYVFGIVKDIDATDDIVAMTMAKVYTMIDQYNPEWQITTWAYKIAFNDSIKWIRERNKKVSLNYYNDKGYEAVSDSIHGSILSSTKISEEEKTEEDHTKEDNLLQEMHGAAIEEMHKLKPIYRDIIIDRLVNNLSYKEIEEKSNEPHIGKYVALLSAVNKAKKTQDDNEIRKAQLELKVFKKKNIINGQTVKNRIIRGRRIIAAKLEDRFNTSVSIPA